MTLQLPQQQKRKQKICDFQCRCATYAAREDARREQVASVVVNPEPLNAERHHGKQESSRVWQTAGEKENRGLFPAQSRRI